MNSWKACKKEHALPDGGARMRVTRSRAAPIHRQHGVLLNETHRAGESVKIPRLMVLVGVRGLEPPTSASRTLRASHLRYTPKMNLVVEARVHWRLARWLGPMSNARPSAGEYIIRSLATARETQGIPNECRAISESHAGPPA